MQLLCWWFRVARATRLEQCRQRFDVIMSQKYAPWLFLSMRIKRLLKFIDITDSIKLCQAAITLELSTPCLYTLHILHFFFSLLPFILIPFLCCIFWRDCDVAMAANLPCRQCQRPMTGSKIGNARSSIDDASRLETRNIDGKCGSDFCCAEQTQFVWKILLVAMHVLYIIIRATTNIIIIIVATATAWALQFVIVIFNRN